MPKVKRSRKPPPDGWELIEPTLDELEGKMKEGEENKMIIIIYVNVKRVREVNSLSCSSLHVPPNESVLGETILQIKHKIH